MSTYPRGLVDDASRQCEGKTRWLTRKLAKQTIRRVRSRTRALQAYRCPHCGFFHTGGYGKRKA